jgi:tRNA A37 threonylcarbamoyladenosine dehydratase
VRPRIDSTVSAWGDQKQADLARLHIGVVGAGSDGCIVAEALARMGICKITLLDFDAVAQINLDRLLHATSGEVGKAKVAVLADALRNSATVLGNSFRVQHRGGSGFSWNA